MSFTRGASGALLIAIGGMADIDAAIAAVGALPPGTLPLRAVSLALVIPIGLALTRGIR